MKCKFCKCVDSVEVDFYQCEKCESIMCHSCTQTSIRTGKDYCEYCLFNMQWKGEQA